MSWIMIGIEADGPIPNDYSMVYGNASDDRGSQHGGEGGGSSEIHFCSIRDHTLT